MTSYDARELAEDWEFKILRSTTGIFGKPERLREVLEEEGRAGWVLVEKFDNQRIRLKRPVTARANDELLDFDPYRTNTGITDAKLAVIIVVGAFCFVAFMGILMAVTLN